MANKCAQCGANLASDAPQGMCPECLLRQGLGALDDPQQGDPAATVAPDGKFTPPTPNELGERFPELEVLELLGQGGFGAVYKVRQRTLDRIVALKLLSPEAAKDATFAERFTREARAMAKLMHPNIVLVFEFGVKDGWYFLLMEYVEGVNLREAIQADQITAEQALAIVPQICDALDYAHEVGVVHRDIKPENILVDKKGRIKIADFGLAKLVGRSPIEITLTATHQIMGTLHYMAPEQIDRPLSVDHRADIYSLGVVFYELLTGELPLGRFKLPSEKVSVDGRLDGVVLKTLEREPESRYQHASEVKTDVETISRLEQVASKPEKKKSKSKDRQPERESASLESTEAKEEIHEAIDLMAGPAAGMVILGAILIAILPLISAVIVPLVVTRMVNDDYFLFNAVFVPGLVQGIMLLIAGLSMRRLGSFELSAIGATVALIPMSPLCVFSIPLGIWAWIVLSKHSVWNAFGNRKRKRVVRQYLTRHTRLEDAEVTEARQQLSMLGTIQLVLGILNIAHPFIIITVTSLVLMNSYAIYHLFPVLLFCLLPSLPIGVVMLLGGLNIRTPSSYATAMIGTIAGLLPFSPLWLISVGISIWTLISLRNDHARKLFRSIQTRERESDTQTSAEDVASARERTAIVSFVMMILGILHLTVFVIMSIAVISNPRTYSPSWLGDDFNGLCFVIGFPSIVIGILMIVGAWHLRSINLFGLALMGVVAMVLPFSPMAMLTIPVGVWAFTVLLSRDVRSAFNQPRRANMSVRVPEKGAPDESMFDFAYAFNQVSLPSKALMLVAVVDLIPLIAIAIAMLRNGPTQYLELLDRMHVTTFELIVFILGGLVAGILVWSGMRMRGLRSYPLCLAASVLAIVPCHVGCIIGLPIGIWSLIVLARTDMQQAFELRPTVEDDEINAVDWPAQV